MKGPLPTVTCENDHCTTSAPWWALTDVGGTQLCRRCAERVMLRMWHTKGINAPDYVYAAEVAAILHTS
jgi:hypothetical protein